MVEIAGIAILLYLWEVQSLNIVKVTETAGNGITLLGTKTIVRDIIVAVNDNKSAFVVPVEISCAISVQWMLVDRNFVPLGYTPRINRGDNIAK